MEDKDLYVLAVMKYKKANPLLNPNNMFSFEWNTSNNYYLKNIIIAEALKKQILVEQTELYQEYFVEKVKNKVKLFDE